MKSMKLKNYFLCTVAAVSMSLASVAQTTIVEQDGSQNEFDPNDWTITNDMGFSTSSGISIGSGETGTLAISNVTPYTQISIEVWLSQGGTTAYTFDASISDGSTTLDNSSTIYTNTNTPKVATYNYNNASPLAISSFVFENLHASQSVTISYLRIYGTPAGGASVEENQKLSNISTAKNAIVVETTFNGKIEVYSITGQQVAQHSVQSGINYYNESHEQGIYFVKLTDADGKVLKTEKIYLQ